MKDACRSRNFSPMFGDPSFVRVEGIDRDGNPAAYESEGFEAVALQHEIDHLDGILFLDRVSDIKTDLFRRKKNRLPERKPQAGGRRPVVRRVKPSDVDFKQREKRKFNAAQELENIVIGFSGAFRGHTSDAKRRTGLRDVHRGFRIAHQSTVPRPNVGGKNQAPVCSPPRGP
jgi:hypothetical protein